LNIFMPKFKHLLSTAAVILTLLAVSSISSTAQARKSSGKPAPWKGVDLQEQTCKGARIPFGPFDYLERKKYPGELFIVEEYHLTAEILNLQQATSSYAINDIQYTLMGWPNHPKALQAAYNYRLQHRGKFRRGINDPSPVECLLQRAINFSPRDPVPYMLLGILMHKFEHYEEALKSFRRANKLLPNDIITLYNLGLTLVALEQYEEAAEVAKEVYSTDFPLPGLKNKLIAAGHWQLEPSEAPPPEQESAPEEQLSAETGEDLSTDTEEELSPQTEEELSIQAEEHLSVQASATSKDSAPIGDEGVNSSIVRQ
jgi:tetratricopeptide (TPR) repeat protein